MRFRFIVREAADRPVSAAGAETAPTGKTGAYPEASGSVSKHDVMR
jgi:hypothetical protein